jgi:two-component system sensor histidine kinase YesM
MTGHTEKLSSHSAHAPRPSFRQYLESVIAYFAESNLSIRTKILLSFFVVILLLGSIDAVVIVQGWRFNREYDAIINNITTANSINGYIKPAIDTEIWNIVAGKTAFAEGSQYVIIDEVNTKIRAMQQNTDSDRAKIKLDVILRTMDTLTHKVDRMGVLVGQGSRVFVNEQLLEEIRSVSALVNDLVQEYILFEVHRAEQNYRLAQNRFTNWMTVYLLALLGAVIFSVAAAWIISESIYGPIKKLRSVTTTIAQRDLQALVNRSNANEIAELGMSFNIMIGKIQELLDAKMQEQENLKKAEFRALQAQINPHFLYNTLDTIVWMAEAKKHEQVIQIVGALSSFFRISLSKGRDWISLRDEIEHTRSYLTIQKMRYRDILDYRIEVEEEALNSTILKLTIQPLVENALYHGIKNKRNGGTITVRVQCHGDDAIQIQIEDDGIGFTPDKLAQLLDEMADTGEIRLQESGFGIENVNKRVKLYYGRQYGLAVTSAYQVGTMVTLLIPRTV